MIKVSSKSCWIIDKGTGIIEPSKNTLWKSKIATNYIVCDFMLTELIESLIDANKDLMKLLKRKHGGSNQ